MIVRRAGILATLFLCLTGCVRTQPQVIVITSTFVPQLPVDGLATPTTGSGAAEPATPAVQPPPTPDPTRSGINPSILREYVVQAGDTLSGIADANGVSLESLLAANSLPDPNVLVIGQVITLPEAPSETTGEFKIVPDSRLVRGPGSGTFDVFAFVGSQPGYIRIATDIVNDQFLSAASVVQRVSLEFSVDARLLLALLEYRAGWLSQLELSDTAKIYPMEGQPSSPGFDRSGLYRQLAWTANQLNYGYYGWKYRLWTILDFEDGTRLLYTSGLNAATVGVQYFLSQNTVYSNWTQQVSLNGFYQTYVRYFGDPFVDSIEPLVPAELAQPELVLPFSPGETWFFTGGPHGGWGSGSAWSAIDFAPPDDRSDQDPLCYVSEFWTTAAADGIIARSDDGSVVLDLDGDGDEATGWSILYLHMATDGRVVAGTRVNPGDRIGRPSCEGGFSNATHMHIARRYNGEWLPAYCDQCAPENETPQFVLGDWYIYGLTNQEYQGYMLKGAEQRTAEQGRIAPDNWVSW